MKDRILLVEKPGPESVSGLFSFPEVEVLEAAGAEQAINIFFHRRPDMIFLDSTLSGAQALVSTIRSEAPWVPVTLICPADALHHTLKEYEPFDVDVVRHPVTRDVVTAALNRCRRLIRSREFHKTGTRSSRYCRRTQQRYRQLFDAVPCHVAVLDRRFRITASNRRFRQDFGDHVGRVLFDILRPASFPPHQDILAQTIQDGKGHKSEVVLTDKEGVQYNMMVWSSPIFTSTGKLHQVLVIFVDITELRKLQDHLSSLGMMVATLSHNLKGSLTGLDAGLYLVEKGFYRNKPGRIEEGLDVAKMMADRIRRMAFDILFSSKERDLDRQAVDVARFAADVAANMENRIRSAHIAFDCDFGTDPGEFEIDAALMRTALTNILENAMDACIEDTAGKISRIRFSARGEADEIVFDISDNGSGMDTDQLKKMFTPFSSSKGHKGTGLGMYITRQMIKKHGGHIRAESHMGSGTRFTIHIPRKPPVTGGI